MREIERHRSLLPPGREPDKCPWRLGVPVLDAHLGPEGLAAAAVHEVKPAAGGAVAGANAAALGFLLRLIARRIAGLERVRGLPRILFCSSAAALSEMGRLYGPGLAALGLDARAFLMVETGRETDALWAIEEGLRSGSFALVAGILGQVALTPARRLSLAAEEYRTPCLLLTGGATPAAGATATRWRAAAAPSGLNPFDPAASGAERYRVSLERCRTAPPDRDASFLLEWSGRAFRHELSEGAADARRQRGWGAA